MQLTAGKFLSTTEEEDSESPAEEEGNLTISSVFRVLRAVVW